MEVLAEISAVEHICNLCRREMPDIVLIAGCTGSGKSTLSRKISEKIDLQRLCLDDYFKDAEEMEVVIPELNILQWDAPDCYRWDILDSNLQDIFRSNAAKIPNFSHEKSKQNGWKFLLLKRRPLLLEGLYALRPEILRVIQDLRLKALSVFLDIPEEVRWKRKYSRDVEGRKENPEALRIWFDKVIRPAEDQWIKPQVEKSDIRIILSQQ